MEAAVGDNFSGRFSSWGWWLCGSFAARPHHEFFRMINPTFSKDITLREGSRTFNFYRLPAPYPSYRVETSDERGQRIEFSMYRSAAGGWRATSHRLPLWVAEAESSLAAAAEVQELFG